MPTRTATSVAGEPTQRAERLPSLNFLNRNRLYELVQGALCDCGIVIDARMLTIDAAPAATHR
jgi:hypothetical protein